MSDAATNDAATSDAATSDAATSDAATRAEAVTLAGLVALLGAAPGVAPVDRVLTGLATAVGGDRCDVTAAVAAELARRYLRAARCFHAGAPAPRSWQVLFRWWEPAVSSPLRATLVGVAVLAGNDLPPAVVSTCTLLGHAPGPAECDAVDSISRTLADIVRDAVLDAGGADPDGAEAAEGLLLLLARRDPWRLAEHLWTLRGRPAEAEAERSALDWRTSAVGRALLA
ncbi:DUF5995 family protein [Pseudonocardia sp. 73-21]|uniref:DUF5995 family protein n=1 Tax=Pseudonocardia sp. 73-21 TaxID=1895809 RepID=UPI0009595938|nr:DUF5995 family protein [Pseudonocardia sp. 73-21]OJY52275.1 MAG: hypothetical protein BGP03_17650 [Pseudonocardia sp. 73-21]